MLRPRIIPCLLIENGRLIKTIKFADAKYVGDPLNAVRIFNEKEADELIILDIGATIENKKPDFGLLKKLARVSRMPLCYGGGVKSFEDFETIISFGIEKISVSSLFFENKNIIKKAIEHFGSQSIVLTLDLKKIKNDYHVFIHRGKTKIAASLENIIIQAERFDFGEIVFNYIDRDGTMEGYDIEHARYLYSKINTPITILGGAGSLDHIKELIKKTGIIGCAAGSLFVFKGKLRAVLINYPDKKVKEMMFTA